MTHLRKPRVLSLRTRVRNEVDLVPLACEDDNEHEDVDGRFYKFCLTFSSFIFLSGVISQCMTPRSILL